MSSTESAILTHVDLSDPELAALAKGQTIWIDGKSISPADLDVSIEDLYAGQAATVKGMVLRY
jgi:hypothetical protein